MELNNVTSTYDLDENDVRAMGGSYPKHVPYAEVHLFMAELQTQLNKVNSRDTSQVALGPKKNEIVASKIKDFNLISRMLIQVGPNLAATDAVASGAEQYLKDLG